MDIDFNVSLLEVNTNPGLEDSSSLIKMLVPRMVDDALRLTIDECFETKYSSEYDFGGDRSCLNSPYPVDGYFDTDNLWYFYFFTFCLFVFFFVYFCAYFFFYRDLIGNMKNDE